MAQEDGPVRDHDDTLLVEAATLVERLMALLFEVLEEKRDWRGVNRRLERVARSAQAEYEQLRQHVERENEEQVLQSLVRLIRKVGRLQRRISSR